MVAGQCRLPLPHKRPMSKATKRCSYVFCSTAEGETAAPTDIWNSRKRSAIRQRVPNAPTAEPEGTLSPARPTNIPDMYPAWRTAREGFDEIADYPRPWPRPRSLMPAGSRRPSIAAGQAPAESRRSVGMTPPAG